LGEEPFFNNGALNRSIAALNLAVHFVSVIGVGLPVATRRRLAGFFNAKRLSPFALTLHFSLFTIHFFERAVSSVVEHLVYTEFWSVFAVFSVSRRDRRETALR
jgi:hypothetical protein